MRSLFLKIFVWFWLAIVLVAGAAVVSTIRFHPGSEQEVARWRHFVGNLLSVQGRAAVEILERNGPDALRDHIEREQRAIGHTIFLFDDHGEELTGRTVPLAAADLAMRQAQAEHGDVLRSEDATLAATDISGSEGKVYVFVGELPTGPSRAAGSRGPRSPPGPPLASRLLRGLMAEPSTLPLVLIAVIITGGVVCYGLARYLTSPVRRLRIAARKLASGELSERVGPQLARRRDELGDLGRDFDLMAERLEALVSGQRQLLRDISHELRSPLARLNVALGIARRQAGVEATVSLDRIERESERLNDLIGQLLTLARLESGAANIQTELVDLAGMVREIVEDANFEAHARKCLVQLSVCDACNITGIPRLLRSAVENVVRNAVLYTAEGTEVEVALRAETGAGNTLAVLTVRDHGPGLPEAALTDVFRPFYRVDNARDRASGGTGLGLAITDRAVRVHGGAVKATNAASGGLLVEITLPLA